MRIVGLLVLGLLIGAVGATMALNALRKANAFPHGVMAVMGYHMKQLGDATTARPCDRAAAERHLRALRVLSEDIEPAFLPADMQDPIFSRYASQLSTRLDGVLGAFPEVECEALRIHLGDIGDGCKACHRDYR